MRIVHYMSTLELGAGGGVARFVLDAALLMAQHDHEVEVLTSDAGDAPKEWIGQASGAQRPRIVATGPALKRGERLDASQLREFAARIDRADVLHVHGMFEPSNIQVARLANAAQTPYVTTIHGMLDHWALSQKWLKKRVYLHLIGRGLIRGSACVHVTSSGELEQARRWFGTTPSVVVPCPFDLDAYRELPGPELARSRYGIVRDGRGPLLLFLARLHPQKGAEFLVRAAGLLKREGLDCRVALAGRGEEAYARSLRELADREGLGDRVALLGQVVGPEKTSLYQAADLFVLPSMQESFGLVLIEAMACATPAVSTFGVDIWQDLKASDAAEIVEQDDRQLADAIRRIVADPSRRAAMSARARPWVFETFRPETLSDQYHAMYESCVRSAPNKAHKLGV